MTWCTCTSSIPKPMEDSTSNLGQPWSGSFHVFLNPTKGRKMTTLSPQGHGMMVFTVQSKRERQVGYLELGSLEKHYRSFNLHHIVVILYFALFR